MTYFAEENIKMYKLKTSCMELTIIETSAYLEMRKQLSLLAVQLEDFRKKVAPPAPDQMIGRTRGVSGSENIEEMPAKL